MNQQNAIACDMTAISASERIQHHELLNAMVGSIRERIELRDGYCFVLDAAVRIPDVAAWIALETRCCPFLRLGLEVGPGASVKVNITGPAGVKDFIVAELGVSGVSPADDEPGKTEAQ